MSDLIAESTGPVMAISSGTIKMPTNERTITLYTFQVSFECEVINKLRKRMLGCDRYARMFGYLRLLIEEKQSAD